MLSFFSKKWKQFLNWIQSSFLSVPQTSKIEQEPQKPCRCRILCVDDDPSFCQYIIRLAKEIDIQIDEAYTVQEAKKLIDSVAYQAYIIDGHLPDGSGFEIVAWIREKKELNAPIGFISRIYRDSKSFRVLKEGWQVDYVLEKPLNPSEVHQLLTKLCHLTDMHIHEPFSEDVLADLKANYKKTITNKVERIEKMILDIQKNPSYNNLRILKTEVHKIAGSAGSYGFPGVSELCKNLELNLTKQMELIKENRFSSKWTTTLDEFFTQIKLRFQMDFQENEALSVKPSYLTTVYVVDEDQATLDIFSKPYNGTHFDVLTEDHPERAIQKLSSLDIYPQILILNDHYRSTLLRGYDLIHSFYKKNDCLCTTMCLMLDKKELGNIVEALQIGMTFIFIKPFSIPIALSLLDQAPFRSLPLLHNVLIIDDDLDICQYIVKTLKFKNLNVDYIQNSLELEKNLTKLQPDLILLDMNLKDQSGEEVLKKLRSELQFNKTIVGMLAFSKDTSLIQKCYHSDVDELLFKPLEAGVLQRKVVNLLKRQTDKLLGVQYDELTGFKNKKTLTQYLKKISQQNHTQPFILVLFEVEGFDILDHTVKKDLLIQISKKIENGLLHKFEMVSYLEDGFFGIVFQGYHPNFIDLIMQTFLIQLNEEIANQTIHLNGCLFVAWKNKELENILHECYNLLDLARQERENQAIGWKNNQPEIKDVVLFQENSFSSDSIKNIFESHDMKITHLNHLNDAFSYVDSFLPIFILLDVTESKKELNVLKQLSLEARVQIPILHLPDKIEESFLLNLLEEIHFFDRPFSLVFLLS